MLKQIKAYFILQYKIIENNIKLRADNKRFNYAIKLANEYHAKSRKQYHVIKQGGIWRVVDNTYIHAYNNKIRDKGKKITVYELVNIAYYSTK